MFRSCALSLQKTTHACDPTTLASTHAHPCIRPAHTRICARASSETNASPPVALHPRAYAPGWLVCAQHFMCALPLSPWPHATFPVHTQARFCALHGKVLHQHAALVDPTKSGGRGQTGVGAALHVRHHRCWPFPLTLPANRPSPAPPLVFPAILRCDLVHCVLVLRYFVFSERQRLARRTPLLSTPPRAGASRRRPLERRFPCAASYGSHFHRMRLQVVASLPLPLEFCLDPWCRSLAHVMYELDGIFALVCTMQSTVCA